MKDPEELSNIELDAEIERLAAQRLRDRRAYPLNWHFIGTADQERLDRCRELRRRRKR